MPVQEYLSKRRARCVGGILGNAERAPWFKKLSHAEQEAFRSLVRDSVGSYHDSVLDLVGAEDGVMRNEEVITVLERVEAAVRASRQRPIPQASLQTGV